MFAKLSLPELIQASRTMFQNAAGNAEIMDLLAPFGYDAAQKEEYADQYEATTAARAAVAALAAKWTRHRKLARLAHRRGSDGYRALGLQGAAPTDAERLVHRAEQFYRLLALEPARLDGLRMDPAEVTEGQALAETAHDALAAQRKEMGEAQRATRVRDDEVAVLRATAHEFAEVTKIALADKPQFREVLGLLERS